MKRIVLIGAFAVSSLLPLGAQNDGGISDGMLQRIRASYEDTPADRALRNAICNNDIRKLVVNQPNQGEIDTYFSHRVPSKGVTDQQQSGRCWLFSGLNVLRARMIARYGLGAFEFSQNYCFFWDQLEKANLFLQGVIDTRDAPREDRTVEWLFKNPLSDGGQFTGVADIVGKYGLVPKEAMPETYSSEHTAQMAALLKLKLREYGLSLREAARDGAEKAELESRKTEMLGVIYRMLVLNLGEPPVRFTWTRRDAEGRPVDTREYTPRSFFETYVADDLTGNYVMLMNDPTRDYYKCYEIDYDIKVTNTVSGQQASLSRVSRDSSGGENQAPFYVAICASLLQIYQKSENSIRLVLLDEAFSKMTSDRIRPMMELFRRLQLQVLLISTVEKSTAIQPYCDITYSIVRHGDANAIAPFYRAGIRADAPEKETEYE